MTDTLNRRQTVALPRYSVTVRYSIKGAVTCRTFRDDRDAARFYLTCLRAGRSPSYI